jgi:hypothetical protein
MNLKQAVNEMKKSLNELMENIDPQMPPKYIDIIVDTFVDNFAGWRESLNAWGRNDSLVYEDRMKYIAIRELVNALGVDTSNLREEAQAVMDAIEEE